MPSFEQDYYEFDAFWNPSVSPIHNQTNLDRVREIYQVIPPNLRKMLDAGCGNGIFCNYAKQQEPTLSIIGFDRSRAALKYVKVPRVRGTVTNIPFANQEFDCVLLLEILEHLPVKIFNETIKESARVADKYILISVPNDQHLGSSMTQCPSCKSLFDPDLHLRTFETGTMGGLFSDYGFECVQVFTIGNYKTLRGPEKLVNIFRRKRVEMESPLCPICGFENKQYLDKANPTICSDANKIDRLIYVVKFRILWKIWPKGNKAIWLVGLYRRIQPEEK